MLARGRGVIRDSSGGEKGALLRAQIPVIQKEEIRTASKNMNMIDPRWDLHR